MSRKRTPDAARVEAFLDDLRSQMPETPAPLASKPPLKDFLVSILGLLTQAVIFGTAAGVGLRIVRTIAGF